MPIPPVEKAIILTAGLGTRFLPMTKTIPKAMLSIIDKPVIQYLVEEALACGIKEIIIVRSPEAKAIEQHFTVNLELEAALEARGKRDLYKDLKTLENAATYHFVVQEEARGDGHAILCAKDFVKDEPFAVLFGDDIIDGPKPALAQLLEIYKERGKPVICTEKVSKDRIHQYGVIDPASVSMRHIKVKGLIEKPSAEKAPSNYGVIGKYICSAQLMDYLEEAESGHKDGEIRLIDGFEKMLEDGKSIDALEVEGTRFDTGKPIGLLQANLHYALKDKEIAKELLSSLKKST
jgi:UTP--glucose-1-phosphate uridylyltransferase